MAYAGNDYTVEGLYQLCKDVEKASSLKNQQREYSASEMDIIMRSTSCGNYFSGYDDGLFMNGLRAASIMKLKDFKVIDSLQPFCVPKGVKNIQKILVFNQWVENNPKERHLDASIRVMCALREAFPCEFPSNPEVLENEEADFYKELFLTIKVYDDLGCGK
ncbi:MAG: hypothetical protein H6863_00690 [Rhodospirillales bacterium]|nr:hypothetical protein [Rhodospirillales bacterium]MCB9979640.1 hypothetical protein [Rhodospirillales bacterium]